MKEPISVNSIHKITENLDIVNVVSEYLNLKKAGKNFKCLCPFHEEKTPSFIVNPEKQIFHCFGCGAGGDAINFLMKIENLPFPQAVMLASEKAGIPVKLGGYSHKDSEAAQNIYGANEFALKAYRSMLLSDAGRIALDYLYERSLGESDIEFFCIGFAPNKNNYLAGLVKEQKLDAEDFIKAGLIKAGGQADVFRNRVIFPIFGFRGEVAGFGGRALDEKYMPKYLNTAENPVFNKGRLLYGMHWAKEHIKEKGFALLVEGYFDVIKLHANGIKNTVAPMGTSLTGSQLNSLKRVADKILLLFDSDQAGIRACLRNLETVLNKGFETKICLLPAGFDPDKFVDDYGADAFVMLMNKSVDFLEFVLDVYAQQYGLDTPKGKSSAAREVMRYIGIIPDEIEKHEYRKMLAEKLGLEENDLIRHAGIKGGQETRHIEERANSSPTPRDSAENLLVQIVLSDRHYWQQLLEWEGAVSPRINLILQKSRELVSNDLQLTPSNLIAGISNTEAQEDISGWIAELALQDMGLPEERKQVVFQDCLKKINKLCICEKLDRIKKEMLVDGSEPQYAKNLETLQMLLFELKKE